MPAKKTTKPKAQPNKATVAATENATEIAGAPATAETAKTSEAKTRFNAAIEEAKAGGKALTDEAKVRAGEYREQARARGEDWATDAKTKAGELAVEGKHKVSEGLSGLSRVIDENAGTLDEKLGAKYGDYARSTSRALQENAQKLDQKSLDELADDTRESIRKSPVAAVGLAAVVGFFFARLFR
ncbi:hypothetical protein [Aurantiacibacter sp. MUD61]|uniref:hypothetical protein n=1 Tax=Aurantiacibacter sp. MUD61 TaxID=3009083 RepID=UPI0022F0AB6A|nr:hypothetical protein [Aurantiacibacter sp. MUD61]